METPRFFEMPVKRALNRVHAPSMPFTWSLNPYRGCGHGCAFCYARGTHEYLGYTADDAFRSRIHVKEQMPEVLEAELAARLRRFGGDVERMAEALGTVAIGTATDPYQAVEAKRRVTRRCLEVLAKYSVRTTLTTRSPLVLRDLDVLKSMRIEGIHISLHTLDAKVWRSFEPATPTPNRRLDAVSRLREAGLPVSVFVAPVLPWITDDLASLAAVMRAAKTHGAQFAMVSALRLAPEVKPWFFSVLERTYPELAARYARMYERRAYPPAWYVNRLDATAERARVEAGFAREPFGAPEARASRPEVPNSAPPAAGGAYVQLRLPL